MALTPSQEEALQQLLAVTASSTPSARERDERILREVGWNVQVCSPAIYLTIPGVIHLSDRVRLTISPVECRRGHLCWRYGTFNDIGRAISAVIAEYPRKRVWLVRAFRGG
jgi:hypothetical protein